MMKVTKTELKQIIQHALVEDFKNDQSVIEEFKLRSFGGGSVTEMCDLSAVPEIFWRYFKAINEGSKESLVREIDADIIELENSSPAIFVGRKERKLSALRKKREKLLNDDNFFEDTFGKFSKSTTWKMLSGGIDFAATAFFGMTKTDCDRIIAFINIFLEFLAPFLGVDVKTLGVATAGVIAGTAIANSTAPAAQNNEMLFANDFGKNLSENNIIGNSRRRELTERDDVSKKIEKEKLINFDLHLFELYANEEYVLFSDDEGADISPAKERLTNLISQIESNVASFNRLKSTLARFVTIPQGRNHAKCVEFIKNIFPWEDYFETSNDAGKFIIKRIKILKKELIDSGIFGF